MVRETRDLGLGEVVVGSRQLAAKSEEGKENRKGAKAAKTKREKPQSTLRAQRGKEGEIRRAGDRQLSGCCSARRRC